MSQLHFSKNMHKYVFKTRGGKSSYKISQQHGIILNTWVNESQLHIAGSKYITIISSNKFQQRINDNKHKCLTP